MLLGQSRPEGDPERLCRCGEGAIEEREHAVSSGAFHGHGHWLPGLRLPDAHPCGQPFDQSSNQAAISAHCGGRHGDGMPLFACSHQHALVWARARVYRANSGSGSRRMSFVGQDGGRVEGQAAMQRLSAQSEGRNEAISVAER